MARLKAIPQTYNGVQLRSKTEKLCAMELDRMGFRWEYEPEGVDVGGLWYLPDFWLPECKTFIECKGIWDPPSLAKVYALWCACLPLNITVGAAELYHREMHFGLVRPTPGDHWFNGGPESPDFDIVDYEGCKAELDYSTNEVFATTCNVCGHPWFYTVTGGYMCPSCGAWDGNGHMGASIEWNLNGVPRPMNQVWYGKQSKEIA